MSFHLLTAAFRLALAVAAQLSDLAPLGTPPHRAALRIRWTADSSWDGEYYRKPYRFHVHEELDGQLVFDVDSLPPRVYAIQLRDDGAAVGATLVGASGSTTYTLEARKEAGDCVAPSPDAPPPAVDAPSTDSEEARASWDSAAPGRALIVFRNGMPVGLAFSPRPAEVSSLHRLLCPQPETVTRRLLHRVVVKGGDLMERRADGAQSDGGRWTLTSAPNAAGVTTTARYRYDARQRNPGRDDPSGAVGHLEVTKVLVLSWESQPMPNSSR